MNPLGDEALAALPQWWAAGSCVPGAGRAVETGGDTRDKGRRDRLRHQLDPPAGGRRRPRRPRRWSTSCAGWRSSGSARASTAPAHRPRGAWTAPWRWPASTPRSARSSGPSASGSWPRPRPATPPTRDEFVDGVREASRRTGSRRRWSAGTRRRRCRSSAPRASCRRTASPVRTSWSTSAAAPRSSSAAPTASEQARSVDIGCVRMTERHLHTDPPTAAEIAAATADIDAAIDRAAEVVDLAGVGALVGLAGSVTTITAHALRADRLRPRADPPGVAAGGPGRRGLHRPAGHDPRRAGGAAGSCTPAGSTSSAPGRWCWRRIVERVHREAGMAQVVTSEHDILDGIALSLA